MGTPAKLDEESKPEGERRRALDRLLQKLSEGELVGRERAERYLWDQGEKFLEHIAKALEITTKRRPKGRPRKLKNRMCPYL